MRDYLGPYLLGPNDTPENGIYTGDCRHLAKAIPDESADLIFADPVYDQLDDYRWLAETGARVLQQDRACLVWAATPLLPKVLAVMIPPLEWAWQLIQRKYGPCYPGRAGITGYTCCLWLDKGRTSRHASVIDVVDVCSGVDIVPINTGHKWAKHAAPIHRWMRAVSGLGDVVFDPFTGGGTVPAVCKMLGRRYLAFEIEAEVAEMARERVRNTQPPLFVPQPEQQEMAL